jgi:hypothetical protein
MSNEVKEPSRRESRQIGIRRFWFVFDTPYCRACCFEGHNAAHCSELECKGGHYEIIKK